MEIVEKKGTSCRRLVSTGFGPLIIEKSVEIWISSFVPPSKIFVWGSRRQRVPFFSTISISTKTSTWTRDWNFCRNVRNGDCRKKGDSLPKDGSVSINAVSTRFGRQNVEKCFVSALGNAGSSFQLFLRPKSSFGGACTYCKDVGWQFLHFNNRIVNDRYLFGCWTTSQWLVRPNFL